MTIETRYNVPTGYKRVNVEKGSFAEFLRNQKLKPYGEKALYYNGKEKASRGIYDSVFDVEIGNQDLHQCADAIMLLRAEYLYSKKEYNKINNSLIIKKFGTTYKMLLRDEMAEVIKSAVISKNLVKLSKASLETLAIIAYNQPITKVQIDKIRGVSSDSILHSLVSKELIVSNKTLDTIGKPKLYETTDLFLDVFGLESIDQLPKSEIISNEEINKFLQN